MDQDKIALLDRIADLIRDNSNSNKVIKALVFALTLVIVFSFLASFVWYSLKRDSSETKENIKEIKKDMGDIKREIEEIRKYQPNKKLNRL